MLFNSLQYLLFLPLVVALFWVAPKAARPYILLVASYYFYMSWLPGYALLLGGLTLANFAIGHVLSKSKEGRRRRLILIAGLTINLSFLALFKYTNFLIDSIWHALRALSPLLPGLFSPGNTAPVLPVILPLGISFFVFEFIHYLSDVYKGSKPIGSPVRFALFAAFFPSQIAGPIKRYQDFDHQLVLEQRFDGQMFQAGLWLIMKGMFKKVALGDNLALIVEAGFGAPSGMGTLDAWVCVIAFALQIFFDFSGYTDIGRGSAMLFGFALPENFKMPYLARNLQDFWRRWHISLSTWLRDYLFIPLGGSRGGEARTCRNLLVTMLLGGLWHGASWHYVIWGGYHGLGLVATRKFDQLAGKLGFGTQLEQSALFGCLSRATTFFLVLLGWVIFRADNVPQALAVYQAMFLLRPSAEPSEAITRYFAQSTLPVSLILFACFSLGIFLYNRKVSKLPLLTPYNWRHIAFWLSPPWSARLLVYGAMALLTVGLSCPRSMPFIYFQF